MAWLASLAEVDVDDVATTAMRTPVATTMPAIVDFPTIGYVEADVVAELRAQHLVEPLADDDNEEVDSVLAEIGDWIEMLGDTPTGLVAFYY